MPPETTETKVEKLEINTEKNYLRKKGDEKKGIKEYIVDFYPIKTIQLNIGNAISYIENEKKIIEKKKEEEEWEKKTEEEKNKIKKEKERINKNRENRANQYLLKLKQLNELMSEGGMNKALYDEKEKLLKEQYKDLFQKNDEEKKKTITKLKKSEFFELLKINLNNFLI